MTAQENETVPENPPADWEPKGYQKPATDDPGAVEGHPAPEETSA